ncbi:hypothetical protein Tco_0970327 [Tanacetum coccineum]
MSCDKELAIPVQTATGKEFSNPLMADSLPKTIWLSIHLVVYNEELAIPGQTATGKESSNPFMAGSLPKTIHFCDSLQKFKNYLSDNEESLGEDASKQGRIDDADAEVPVIFAGTPSSTTIDQDAPCHSSSSSKLHPLISHQGVAARSTIIEDNPFAHVNNDHFVNVFALEPSSEASSGDASSAESTHVTQPHHHLGKWSKDHPLDNVICNPS